VDSVLLRALAPVIPVLTPSTGKAALATVPDVPLLDETVTRAKTGFGVPTGAWLDAAASELTSSTTRKCDSKGLVSRRWSQVVLNGAGSRGATCYQDRTPA
jgi:asparagine synthase (glutamine-hydrolysing)